VLLAGGSAICRRLTLVQVSRRIAERASRAPGPHWVRSRLVGVSQVCRETAKLSIPQQTNVSPSVSYVRSPKPVIVDLRVMPGNFVNDLFWELINFDPMEPSPVQRSAALNDVVSQNVVDSCPVSGDLNGHNYALPVRLLDFFCPLAVNHKSPVRASRISAGSL
jgi:hypothetical protein